MTRTLKVVLLFLPWAFSGCGSEEDTLPSTPAPTSIRSERAPSLEEVALLEELENIGVPDIPLGSSTPSFERHSLGPEDAREAGLTREEAQFEGEWDHRSWGLDLHPGRTFTFWTSRVKALSRGTWTVATGKLRLTHTQFGGVPLEGPIVSEHTLDQLHGRVTTAEESMRVIRVLHRNLMRMIERTPVDPK